MRARIPLLNPEAMKLMNKRLPFTGLLPATSDALTGKMAVCRYQIMTYRIV
jgi:hypothetical protein